MNDFGLSVYMSEIARQCEYGLDAADQLGWAVANRKTKFETCEERQRVGRDVFRSVHSLLTHAANVSRLLWPPRSKGSQRAHRLRSELNLEETGHPLEDRRLRDHLEHFDERLDEWYCSSVHQHFVHDCVGRCDEYHGISEDDVMRWLDPESMTFSFRGEHFDLVKIVSALESLREVAAGTAQAAMDRHCSEEG